MLHALAPLSPAAAPHRRGAACSPCPAARDELFAALSQAGSAQAAVLRDAAANTATSAASYLAQLAPPPPGWPPGPAEDAAVSLATTPLPFLTATRAAYGGLVGLRIGGLRAVLVSRAEWAACVLEDASGAYVKAGTAFLPSSQLAGNGLLVSDGDTWRRQRRLAAPAFRSAAVAAYAAGVRAATERLLATPVWSSGAGSELDVYDAFNGLSLRVAGEALFSSSWEGEGPQLAAAISAAFAFFNARAAQLLPLPEWVPSPDNAAFAAATATLDAAVYKLIAGRRAVAGAPPADLLSALLAAREEDGSGMSDTALRDELMTLLVAGQETSAIVLAWTSSYLAQHPAVQEAAAAEARRAAQPGGPLSAGGEYSVRGATEALPLTTACVFEAMRLRPPAYLVGRCAARDVRLGPWRVPGGTTLLVSPYLLHHSSAWGPTAASFDPHRWLAADGTLLPDALKGMGPHGAYIPFGAGARNCIGAGFALMEAQLVLGRLLCAVRLALPADGEVPVAAPRITLRPAAVRLRVTRRPQ